MSSISTNLSFIVNSAGDLHVTSKTASTSTNTGALVVEGGTGIGGELHVDGAIYSKGEEITGQPAFTTVVIPATLSTVLLHTFSVATHRSAKYTIQVTEGTGASAKIQISELFLMTDNDTNLNLYTIFNLTLPTGVPEPMQYTFDLQSDGIVKTSGIPTNATDKVVKISVIFTPV